MPTPATSYWWTIRPGFTVSASIGPLLDHEGNFDEPSQDHARRPRLLDADADNARPNDAGGEPCRSVSKPSGHHCRPIPRGRHRRPDRPHYWAGAITQVESDRRR